MKYVIVVSALIISTASFAKSHGTPKFEYSYEVCQAVHAGKCWEKTDKAVVSCDSDLNKVCQAIDSKYTHAVEGSVKCKTLDMSFGDKLGQNTLTIMSDAYIYISGMCDDGNCQMMMLPGKAVPYYKINSAGEKELDADHIMTDLQAKSAGMKEEESKIKFIKSIKCE